MDELAIMSDVLEKEADAIKRLSHELGDKHEKLIETCYECKGKIVLTGMGKSGHVARKISATLASLGNPSFYLHPGEAAHGDLGMVERQDIVIMVSKSGETEELLQLIPSLKIIGCKLIAFVCNEGSSIEQYCDITIVLPVEEEACIHNLAPTVSTSLTMALGDALAVTLSAKKGFDRNQFALFHPKGSLGKQLLLTVYDLANKNIAEIGICSDENIKSVLWHITRNRLGAVSVVNKKGKLIGLVSDGDIRRGIEKYSDIFERKAVDVMTDKPKFVNKNMLAVDAFKKMSEEKISVLPLVDDNDVLTGMVSFHDIVASGIGVK